MVRISKAALLRRYAFETAHCNVILNRCIGDRMLKRFYEFKENRYKKYIENKWPLIRKKGRTRFTIIKSILYAIFWSIIFQIALRKFSIIANISGLTVGFMAGLLLADGEWAKNEKEYLKLNNKTPV